MNSFRRDPCKVCGSGLIEHDGRPFDVTCTLCMIGARKGPPPTPPPMRQVGNVQYSAWLFLYTFLVLLAGFLMGFAVRL